MADGLLPFFKRMFTRRGILIPAVGALIAMALQMLPGIIIDLVNEVEKTCAVIIERSDVNIGKNGEISSLVVTLHQFGKVPAAAGLLQIYSKETTLRSVMAILDKHSNVPPEFVGQSCPHFDEDNKPKTDIDGFCDEFSEVAGGYRALAVKVPQFDQGYNPSYRVQFLPNNGGDAHEIWFLYEPSSEPKCPAHEPNFVERVMLWPNLLKLIVAVLILLVLSAINAALSTSPKGKQS